MQFIPRGVVIIQFTSSPLFFSSKRLVVRSTRNYALPWKALEGAATFGAGFDLCPIADFKNSQFSLFRPPPNSPLLAKFLERSRNSQNRCLPNRPVFNQSRRSWNSMRWACATQPGLPPLHAQFRLGVLVDGSSFLFLGLGEFVWCDRVGFFNNKKVSFGNSY